MHHVLIPDIHPLVFQKLRGIQILYCNIHLSLIDASISLDMLSSSNKIMMPMRVDKVALIDWPLGRVRISSSRDGIFITRKSIREMTIKDINWDRPRTAISTKHGALGNHHTMPNPLGGNNQTLGQHPRLVGTIEPVQETAKRAKVNKGIK
jgi:hypothetical protein